MEAQLRNQLEALRERAELLSDENYHSEASTLSRIINLVASSTDSADQILLMVLKELEKFGDV